jgi:hypothetical protein
VVNAIGTVEEHVDAGNSEVLLVRRVIRGADDRLDLRLRVLFEAGSPGVVERLAGDGILHVLRHAAQEVRERRRRAADEFTAGHAGVHVDVGDGVLRQ